MARIVCALLMVLAAVAAEETEGGKCERIRLPLCQDLGYNWTAMPNLVGHRDQKEAEEAMSMFADILSSGCSPHARFLLCSAFAPLCSEQVSGSVSACRALCESVAEDCRDRLALLPTQLDCAAFPRRADRRLCMRPPNASELEPEPPPPPRWPFADAEPRERPCPPAGACGPACDPADPPSEAIEIWTTTLAWVALLSTSFALLTFCAEPSRYRYPERPVVWIAACHAVVALAYAARGWVGAPAACGGAGGEAGALCVAFFALTYYFTLAADAWFANACVAWYLTAASEWSTEALERAAAYLHAAAWGWAGAWTAAALALRGGGGGGDECGGGEAGAGALAGVARGAALAAGLAAGLGAAPGVARVRRALGGRGAARVGRLAARAGAAGLAYLVLAGAAAAARGEAARRARAGAGAGAAAAWPALGLAGAAAAGAWAWSRKSAAVWRRALCPPRKTPGAAPPLLRPPPTYYKRPLPVSRV